MTDLELEQFVTEYGADIYSFCRCLTGSRQETDDLYQETFLRAVEKKEILDAAGNPKSYLLSTAVRLWKNQRRKAAWRGRIADVRQPGDDAGLWERQEEPGNLPEQELLREEERAAVRHAVDRLPDKMKVTVLLYYMEDRSVEQISGILHIPQGTVKSRLYQARKFLQNELGYMLNE